MTGRASQDPNGQHWLAADPVGQNETYLGNRLLFQRAGTVETGLVDTVSGTQARRILRRTFGYALLIILVTTVGSTLLPGTSVPSSSDAGSTDTNPIAALGLAASLLWICWHLFVPITEILSDWHLLLDGKAQVADTAYGVVFTALRVEHEIPAAIEPRRMWVGPPVRGIRNLLRIRIGKYSILVSVFAFGRDLFLGWTLWRRQVPVMIVLRWLASILGSDPGFSGVIDMEPIKAMRETVHNALRRGIEAAAAGRQVPIAQSFGYDLPIEVLGEVPAENGSAAPNPGPPAAAGPRPPAERSGRLAVVHRVQVYTVDGPGPVGYAEPGTTYEFLGEDGAGLVVRDERGSVWMIREKSSVRPA